MFTYETRIKLRDTDAAGVIYFPRLFELVSDAYEAFLAEGGFDIFNAYAGKTDFLLPVVHAEADYQAPLRAGDRIGIEVVVERIGTSSYSFVFTVRNESGGICAVARKSHVAVSRTTWKSVPIPEPVANALRENA